MNASRWNYLKNLSAPAPRLVFGPGTYNVGRNADKRADRKADIARRVAARRAR